MPRQCSPDVQTSGKILPALRRAAQAGFELLLRERALREERFHQRFVGLGHHLDQLFARMRRRVRQGGGNLAFGHLAAAVGREGQRLHAHQVDDALEVVLLADRQLDRHDLAGAVAVQRLEGALEAGALALEAVQRDDARQY